MNKSNVIPFPATKVAGQVIPFDAAKRPATKLIDFTDYKTRSRQSLQDDLLTPHDVWEALNEGRMVMHYQPQYDMRTGKTVAAEALVRLIDRDDQLIYPDRFIDTTEQSDIIVPLGRAVIEQVCVDLRACRAEGIEIQRIAINLSAHQLNIDTTLLNFVDNVIARHGLKYDDLEFEITERQNLTSNCAGIDLLKKLNQRGARIVIDDFGIGYSSVVYLTELPISAFKLDRALVSRLPEDKAMQSVVKSLLRLAEDLDVDVVAEGIETKEQNEYLAHAGCPFAQGFGYAKPMAIANFQAFLTENRAASEQSHLRF